MTKQSMASNDLTDKVKENYQSIVLGLIVFLIAITAIYRALGNKAKPGASTKSVEIKNEQGTVVENESGQKVYIVKKGDTLWKIAENLYGSGYNFVDVAKTNKLKNANRIEVGTKLVVPSVAPKKLTKGMVAKVSTSKVTITGDSYTVKRGDHLWKIAVGAYGDGYAWVKIARTNKLRNPGIIRPGQVLKLPR